MLQLLVALELAERNRCFILAHLYEKMGALNASNNRKVVLKL